MAKTKYRSGFERLVAQSLKQRKAKVVYEPKKIPFTQPEKTRTYTPDWLFVDTGIYVETKGRLTKADRDKLVWVKNQHPDLQIVILFQDAEVPIRRGSKTTFGDWATKNGFEWADFDAGIPRRWYKA